VARLRQTPHQEIATHTLSHLTCLEPGPGAEDFRADLAAALDLHQDRLGTRPTSIVFPRNQVAHLGVCAELGLTAFRGPAAGRLYAPRPENRERRARRALRLVDAYLPLGAPTTWEPRPQRPADLPVDIPASRLFRPPLSPLGRLDPLRLRRIEQEMERAAMRGHIFHLWWHPHNLGPDPDRGLADIARVLDRFRRLSERHGMVSLTMAEAAARLRAAPVPASAVGVAP
ncbi:MAG: hypothetical protein D6798_18720, partial [Deltaproteobacteria bacterium]